MLKRKIYDNLLNWKKNKKNECLIVNGARQVGKTFIIEQFGKKNYSSFISINFIKNPEYAYKLTDGIIGTDGRKITMPHYMAMFI